jgi:hypothetical protein
MILAGGDMTCARLLRLGLLLAAATAAPRPVAIVYSLTGHATLEARGETLRPVQPFDRLATGTTVEVGPGSRLSLAFLNGRRYELGERAKGSVGAKDLTSTSGAVRSLPSIPPLPLVSPIAAGDHPGPRAGAVRVRGERITGLYPSGGAATLARATILRFDRLDGDLQYRIEVLDRRGNLVFEVETKAATVTIPPDVLRSGARYAWTVRTVEREGPTARGQADFATLPARMAEQREALRQALTVEGDGAALALLAEVDWSLGLFAEARDELRAAVLQSPGDSLLAARLAWRERLETATASPQR